MLVKGALPREPSQYATLGETVNVTAVVTDAETPVNQLTYEWSSSVGGTFGGNAASTTWTAPATLPGTTPVSATLTLTVTERVDATHNNRVTATKTIDLAVPHTLSLTFVPKWLAALERDFASINSRLIALNVHDAVLQLVEGGCDLLLCYHHPRQPVQLDPGRYDMLVLGREALPGVCPGGPQPV